MGNVDPPVKFCEGCPFANGVTESDSVVSWSAGAVVPNPGIQVGFVGEDGQETYRARTGRNYGDWDSTMESATAFSTVDSVRDCDGVQQEKKKVLGVPLGNMTVKRCGAFPGENPKKPHIPLSSNGYMYEGFDW